jgi:hypothetical protein
MRGHPPDEIIVYLSGDPTTPLNNFTPASGNLAETYYDPTNNILGVVNATCARYWLYVYAAAKGAGDAGADVAPAPQEAGE